MIQFRIISFVTALLCAVFLPFWVFVCISCAYALTWTPFELIIIGVYIDAQFGNPNAGVWFMYTLTAIIFVGISILAKPYLRFYNS
ncbi:MAG: hypothetical protein NUW00_01570 [Candidatus Kaiserbacteria bacterium]|nr:hypothetical protein [Candidatus Kaiserbacteria bacterium]